MPSPVFTQCSYKAFEVWKILNFNHYVSRRGISLNLNLLFENCLILQHYLVFVCSVWLLKTKLAIIKPPQDQNIQSK